MGEEEGTIARFIQLSFEGLFPREEDQAWFTHGCQFWKIYQSINPDDGFVPSGAEIKAAVRVELKAIFERAAAAHGWDVSFEQYDDEWLSMTAVKIANLDRPNPRGLRLVS
jgi:hypothetical protein